MTVYLAHATSFCAGVWRPVREALPGIETVAWDFVGHGSANAVDLPVDWADFGLQVLDETEPGGVAVGHSMGAAAMVMAQLDDPTRFRAMVLIEPVIFPPPFERREHEFSVGALKRRPEFESREEARENFAAKAFASWDPEALDGYIDCGFVGEGPVTLACPPEVEAEMYWGSAAHETWTRLPEIEVPVLVLAGADSTFWTEEEIRLQASRYAKAGIEFVPSTSHFLPMENPGLVAERARRLVEAVS